MAKSSDSKPENIGSSPVSSAKYLSRFLLYYKEIFYYIVADMMINDLQVPDEEKVTFATNWYNTANDIFQLIISDYIWQTRGIDNTDPVSIEKHDIDENNGLLKDQQTGDLVGGVTFNPQEGIYTLYANEKY